MSTYKSHIITKDSITIIVAGGPPITVLSNQANFKEVSRHLGRQEFSKAVEKADVKAAITAASAASAQRKNVPLLEVKGDRVVIDGEALPLALSARLIQFQENGIDFAPLLKFWSNLKSNPRADSKEDLYAFLEANHVPLTEDGCFVGYKYVGQNFKDRYTGTFDNTPGKVVSMDRASVDPNRTNTCSRGLHVAAYSYAKNQKGSSDIIVEVKVNPVDVVTVPPDYNQQKMRVCKYTVIRVMGGDQEEIKDELYDEKKREAEVKIVPVRKPTKPSKTSEFEELKFDSSGRARISKSLLAKIGQGDNAKVYKNTKSPGLLLTLAASLPASITVLATYAIDKKSGTVRLSKSILKKAGLDDTREYRIKADSDVELKIYPAR